MHALAAALVLAACAAKKSSKVKATKPPNEYSTKNTTIAASPWRRNVDGHLYIHGGKLTDQATSALKDLWRYDLVGRTWSEMHPAVAPSSRYLHNMAAWPGGHAIVLFGGEHIKSRKSGKKKYARLNDV